MDIKLNQRLRTHYAGKVHLAPHDQEVVLMGWVNSRRDHGGVIFVDLRDLTGLVQLVMNEQMPADKFNLANEIRSEFVIAIRGHTKPRSAETINDKLPTGKIEVVVEDLAILNTSLPLPFPLDNVELSNESLRLKYRYLDLRRRELQHNILLRAQVSQTVRSFLVDHHFHEIETPVLTKSTPEGARDFLVPSRLNAGEFFALPQSPQLFKQILMVAGFDRYFQLVKCFRDEDLRGNRQPEFTQIDLELSFTNEDEIQTLMEGMVRAIFKAALGLELKTPFPRITYQEAMESYGSDAPDLRFGLLLNDVSAVFQGCGFKVFQDALAKKGVIKAIVVPDGDRLLSRKDLDELTEVAKIFKAKGMAWAKVVGGLWQSPIAKFIPETAQKECNALLKAQDGDILLFGADQAGIVHAALGNVRKDLGKRLKLTQANEFRFVWVVEFPMLEYNEEEKRYQAAHHPFTQPFQDDLALFAASDPGQIRAHAYDLVLNGVELGGGSMRNHTPEMQSKVFDLLGISLKEAAAKFGFLLEALAFGAPPHGGIAFGFDRILMFLARTESIRDVIPFPKTQQASDLMSGAPSAVDSKQLKELKIALVKPPLKE